MFTLLYTEGCSFTLYGCYVLDCLTILFIIAAVIIKNLEERRRDMKKKSTFPGRIVYECPKGAVIHMFDDQQLWVFEKVDGRLIRCFEVPTIGEGVQYLKSI